MNTLQTSNGDIVSRVPSVSVILTVYKRTEYLSEALNSALAQSYGDFEILVVDDSGTASSHNIVSACTDPRVRYLANQTTLGIARSLARAVNQARGEFVAILNDDDVWEMNLLAELTVPFENEADCVVAFADHWVMDEAGHIDRALSDTWSVAAGRSGLPIGVVPDPVTFTIRQHGIPVANTAVFRKDAVDWSLLVPEISGAYDYWISCLLIACRRPIYYVPKRLARYRLHGEMETHRRSREKGENLIYILKMLREHRWFSELDCVIKARLADALLEAARNKLHFGNSRESCSLFWRSFLLSYRPIALAGAVGALLPRSFRKKLWSVIGPLLDPRDKQRTSGEILISTARPEEIGTNLRS